MMRFRKPKKKKKREIHHKIFIKNTHAFTYTITRIRELINLMITKKLDGKQKKKLYTITLLILMTIEDWNQYLYACKLK